MIKLLSTTIVILIVTVSVLSSCVKEEQINTPNNIINVSYSKVGSVSIQVKGKDVDHFDGANVEIIREDPEINTYVSVKSGETDANGMFYSGDLLAGVYRCVVNVYDGQFYYVETKIFQITTDYNRYLELTPFENICQLNLTVVEDDFANNFPPLANLNIGILEGYYGEFTNEPFDTIISKVQFSGITDAEGTISFSNLPSTNYSSREYTVLAYTDNNNYDLGWVSVFGNELTRTINVSLN